MSRAFVKESDDELTAGELPERAVSDQPNYVTPRGLEMLRARMKELQTQRDELAAADEPMAKQKLAEIKRDLRYFNAQLERATVVDPAGQPRDEVRFGASVTISDENGKRQTFHIVGDDEADVSASRISWAAPLAKALIGSKVGDTVMWQRGGGGAEVEIEAIAYEGDNVQPGR
jgi:transcription elongation factor GreB